jgi:hypothetical protein
MTFDEKTLNDAPVWYTSAEATAWAHGYNAALDAVRDHVEQQNRRMAHVTTRLDDDPVDDPIAVSRAAASDAMSRRRREDSSS